jgi:hypothetical protein
LAPLKKTVRGSGGKREKGQVKARGGIVWDCVSNGIGPHHSHEKECFDRVFKGNGFIDVWIDNNNKI